MAGTWGSTSGRAQWDCSQEASASPEFPTPVCLTCAPVYCAKLPPNVNPIGVTAVKSPQFPTKPPMSPRTEQTNSPIPMSPIVEVRAHHAVTTSPPQHSNLPLRSSVPPSPTSYIHRSIGQALSSRGNGEESPVMNETLSVINEHITDLSTPRQSLAPPQALTEDTESEYSLSHHDSHLDRSSYIAGPETDSEENPHPTEADVKLWDAKETAEYLRDLGVDSKHCDIFEEQEITGDVLLDMDQSFIHMKDFDFGLMGRRLKTWHKIREFQNQVRGGKDSRKSSLKHTGSNDDVARSSVRVTTLLPRIPSLTEERGLSIRPSQHTHPYIHIHSTSPPPDQPMSPTSFARSQLGQSTPPSPWRASMAADSPTRPSAASIREMSHSRRHSSIEYAKSGIQEPLSAHKKNASFDRDWSMSNATTANTGGSTPSLKLNISNQPPSIDLSTDADFDGENSTVDLDRGYFSGNELDNRKARNLLRKRGGAESAGHSRQSSAMDDSSRPALGLKRHSRLSSVDSIRDRALSTISPAAKAYHSSSYKARFRSSSARNLTPIRSPVAPAPTVTNLEEESLPALSSPKPVSGSTSPVGATPAGWSSSAKARKLLGMRAASEAVTGNEKDAAASSSNITSDTLDESPVASPSGSQTPSATSRSFDVDNTDTSSKGTTDQLGPLLHTKTAVRTNPKTKRQTSAYTKGLMQISPAEARKHCDYSGWMKKRSTGLVAQWKPRLFVLRGRRLSYYYSENDSEEKGIIDISAHKVLGTTADPLTSLSSVMTGKSTPPVKSAGSSAEASPDVARGSPGGAPFYFKLVPPKAGSSRAVQVTKPTVHVFQVDNITEGRKWMAEILKATIEHDLTSYETTNRQKTISLAKARARKERPPALKGTEAEIAELAEQHTPQEEKGEQETGLNIQGLEFNESNIDLQLGPAPKDSARPSSQKIMEGGGLKL